MELGKSLRKHPDAAALLLTAYDSDPYPWDSQVRFAQAVFKYAQKTLLPVLHKSLTSGDRVVRSNAARACGAVGDTSSIPHLIKALSLESGLSRASIVWALGELKGKEVLPHLAKLYVDARNDEKRRRGAGFRASQSGAAIKAHYDSIRDLNAIGSEWDELKAALRPQPVEPRKNEELLEPRHILEAVSKIGPAASQEFYRTLAGEKDEEGRREAAVHLAEVNKEDIEENQSILRNLLADTETSVRIRAAVSLLILGQEMTRGPLLEWLNSPNAWEKYQLLEQLGRVKEGEQLSFARKQLEAIAVDKSLDSEMRRLAQQLIVREK